MCFEGGRMRVNYESAEKFSIGEFSFLIHPNIVINDGKLKLPTILIDKKTGENIFADDEIKKTDYKLTVYFKDQILFTQRKLIYNEDINVFMENVVKVAKNSIEQLKKACEKALK